MTSLSRRTGMVAATALMLASASTMADAQNFDRGGFRGTRTDKLHRNSPDARRGPGLGALGLLGAGLYGASGGFGDGCEPLGYDAFPTDECG